ncbi:LysR family transcriptional regulator [Motiliproteus coralliicola]|uniref:LysR family transcriptional regulator n=1 Tax=Motiliproteus coralliicola TaxID=2283196 RepID=A0A369WGU4_9GAMM|nr:LysR substrate-binding domain-containing protein [Motiliproteus coralliicola]RDE19836.1 LysR family transcriptional regulator [Motiliproteus coralliicola]
MQRAMPPLRALVAFESAVRNGSFKQAAAELHITPGAVSQQVQKLENWLGYPLFMRRVRKLTVTDRGLDYYGRIAPALEQISNSSEACRYGATNRVCLSMTQTLASKWLGPRLEHFVSQHPEIEVHINASNSPVQFQTDAVDLAVRHFDGEDPQLDVTLVFDDEVCLFCSPEYQQTKQLIDVDQLQQATLIVNSLQPFWDRWLNAFSTITAEQRQQIATLHFDQALLAIDAAKRHQGVVLGSELMIQEELKRGELIEPFKQRLPLDKSYYLIHPKRQPLTRASTTLKTWLLNQFSVSE